MSNFHDTESYMMESSFPTGTLPQTYTYNTRGELATSTQQQSANAYTYDFIGNIQSLTHNGNTIQRQYNSINQIENTCAYDLDGNLILDANNRYCYDAQGRLSSVESLAGNSRSEYEYDPFGRRVAKIVYENSGDGWQVARIHRFYYDGSEVFQELISDSAGGDYKIEYFWGVDISGTYKGAGGIGGLIAVSIDGDFYIPIYDFNGNIVKYISGTGTTVAEYTYDAFGNLLDSTDTIGFRHRFSTKYYDPETGLYYYGFRYYSPTTQRWISRDPIEEQGGINLYEFCENKTIIKCDSLGLTPMAADLWNYYSQVSYETIPDHGDFWRLVGGSLKKFLWPDEDKPPPNACAARLSAALAQIPNEGIGRRREFINDTSKYPGIPGNYIVNARNMGLYLRETWGMSSKCSEIDAYYFKSSVKAADLKGLRNEIKNKILCCNYDSSKYVAVIVSTETGMPRISGHVAVVTESYADDHTPYTDTTEVWILPPTKLPQKNEK